MQRILPVLFALIALILITWWSGQEWQALDQAERDRSQAGGEAILDTLIGSLQAGVRRDRIATLHMQTVVESVLKSARLLGFRLDLGGEQGFSAGLDLPEPRLSSDAGVEEHPGMLLFWRRIHLQDDSFGRHGRGPNNQESTAFLPLDASGQRVLIGLDLGPRQAAIDAGRRRVLMAGVTAAALVLAMSAWMLLAARSRLLQHQLQQARAQAEHLMELHLAAAGLAHETKNPLGIIRGLAQRMGEADDPLAMRDDAMAIVQEADVAVARLGDFLRYARDPKPTLAAVSLPELVSKISGLLSAEIATHGLSLSSAGPPCCVLADAQLCEQMLMNLLLNALQACAPGCHLRITWSLVGERANWAIADDGPGIPPDILPDVCKPYVSGRSDGHGLGLALVRRFAEAQGWRLGIDSSAKGTTMTIMNMQIVPGCR
jgi:signal transduction histidine kinase